MSAKKPKPVNPPPKGKDKLGYNPPPPPRPKVPDTKGYNPPPPPKKK